MDAQPEFASKINNAAFYLYNFVIDKERHYFCHQTNRTFHLKSYEKMLDLRKKNDGPITTYFQRLETFGYQVVGI